MRRNRSKRTFGRWSGGGLRLAAIALVGAGVAACDGSNAFQPVSQGPRIVELEAPALVSSGETFQVKARTVALVRVDSLVVSAEGSGLSTRQVQTNGTPSAEILHTFEFMVPDVIGDTIIEIRGFSVDAQRNVSPVEVRTVRVRDMNPPTVTLGNLTPNVSQGDTIRLRVTAADNLGLTSFGLTIRTPSGATFASDSIPVSGTQADSTFRYVLPEVVEFGAWSVQAFARDLAGNRNTATSTVNVSFTDRDPPSVTILLPTTGTAVFVTGDSAFVRARATDNDELARITFRGEALFGSAELGTLEGVQRFLPMETTFAEGTGVSDTTLNRYLRFDFASMQSSPPTSSTETLALIVEAEDRAGFVRADTVLATLNHDVTPPAVTITAPNEDAQRFFDDPLTVEYTVSDNNGPVRTGVNAITIEVQSIVGNAITGDTTVTALIQPVSFTLQDLGASGPIIESRNFAFTIPGLNQDTPAPDRYFFVIVTARDRAGNLGADTLRMRSLGARPDDDDMVLPGGLATSLGAWSQPSSASFSYPFEPRRQALRP